MVSSSHVLTCLCGAKWFDCNCPVTLLPSRAYETYELDDAYTITPPLGVACPSPSNPFAKVHALQQERQAHWDKSDEITNTLNAEIDQGFKDLDEHVDAMSNGDMPF